MLKVYYPVDPPTSPGGEEKAAWDVLQARLDPEVELLTGTQLPQPAAYHILVSGRPTAQQLSASPHLHTLIIPWAGLSASASELLRLHPHLLVHNLPYNAVTTAESALMLLLAVAKQILPIERQFRQHDWRPRYQSPNPAVMLHGKTILILGYGRIGQQVGKVCQAMGMQVVATRRNLDRPRIDSQGVAIYPASEMHRLLPQVKILMITLPLTAETEGLIGEAELNSLPDQAILVNVGRGPVVDQQALYQALKTGRLHSAGVDVWYNYPPDEASRAQTPPAEFPFEELDNIVMSPHRGGGAQESEVLRMEHLAEILHLAAHGHPLPNRVYPDRGY